jgi:hypothetical protein
MPMPDLPVIAEGETARGEHWYLRAGGTPLEYYTMLRTVHPDGRQDEGGMGGPVRYPGRLFNLYTGRADDGPLRVIVRTDPGVRRLRIHLAQGEYRDLTPAADDAAIGLTFFATLLPGATSIDQIEGFGADGQPLAD